MKGVLSLCLSLREARWALRLFSQSRPYLYRLHPCLSSSARSRHRWEVRMASCKCRSISACAEHAAGTPLARGPAQDRHRGLCGLGCCGLRRRRGLGCDQPCTVHRIQYCITKSHNKCHKTSDEREGFFHGVNTPFAVLSTSTRSEDRVNGTRSCRLESRPYDAMGSHKAKSMD